MAIKFNAVKCPECGANLPIEEGRDKIFCSYCGTKVIITNENEYIYRNIDEAKVKQAEANENIQLKKLEILEKKRADDENTKKTKIKISIILGVAAILFMIIGYGGNHIELMMPGLVCLYILFFMWIDKKNNNDTDPLSEKIRVPNSIEDYESKTYQVVEAIMTSAGFINVKSIPLNDLTTGLFKKPGMVESITINGVDIDGGGQMFSPESTVIISYHSF